VAVRSGSGDTTFAELDARAEALAARLVGAGAAPGSLVGICLGSSEHCVEAVLATWKAGAGYVALDPADDTDHLASVVDDAALVLVVAPSSHRPPWLSPQVALVDIGAEDQKGTVSTGPTGPGPVSKGPTGPGPVSKGPTGPGPVSKGPTGPGDVAMVFYGSGSSRVERGVVIEHRSLMHLLAGLRACVWPETAGLRVALSARPTDDAFARQLMALVGGHTLEVVGPDTDPETTVGLVAAAGVDLVDVGPECFTALDAAGLQEAVLARPAGAVVPTIVVGSRHSVDHRSWWSLGRVRGAQTYVLYGPPELGFGATVDPTPGTGGRVTIGRPMTGTTAQVLGPGRLPVPMQVTGVLHVGGAGLARGLDPFDTGQRARVLPDGRVELLGAVSDSVELGGFRIDRSRIEAVLGRCPGVADIRIEMRQDSTGGPRLVATAVAEGEAVVDPNQLRVFLWSQLPGYAWPADVVVVAERGSPGREAAVPGGGEEELLATAWADLLGVDQLGRQANYWQQFSFLDALTQAAAAGAHIGAEQVMRNRTIATLAADMAVGRAAGTSAGRK